jgi:hypothetical protein
MSISGSPSILVSAARPSSIPGGAIPAPVVQRREIEIPPCPIGLLDPDATAIADGGGLDDLGRAGTRPSWYA